MIEPTAGTLTFEGRDVLCLGKTELREIRREMQIVFQDPYASLNPRMRVEDIVVEPLAIHGIGNKTERRQRVADLLARVVWTPPTRDDTHMSFQVGSVSASVLPELSALQPKLIVADEPVSALDVSVQAQVVNLLQDSEANLA